ncbi:MAG: hypothetical protein EZS28_005592 [Streblomastix strix]|uniref:Uncharacterized protein n=1 Tax=Streblomastix strix TaxID=222440 RepID=A0A5J4WVN2_9EUKA|nr:MAG: hypothetical protein EZS28_005592 [Streblomastix strix]
MSFRETKDEILTATNASIAPQGVALNVLFTISANKSAFKLAQQSYVDATITATSNQTLRNILNSFERGKAIAAGKVGPNEVVSKDVLKTMKEARTIHFEKPASKAEQVESAIPPLKKNFQNKKYYKSYDN